MEATRKPRQWPEDHFVRYEPTAHRTFYREGGVWITDRWLTITGRRFAVDELQNLRTVREPAAPVAIVATAIASVLVLVTVAFVALSAPQALLITGPFLATLPVGVGVVTWRLRHRYLALHAEYRGETVLVLDGFDERRYNQVCRALVRAREYSRDHMYY
jgi:fatty acid desaturase